MVYMHPSEVEVAAIEGLMRERQLNWLPIRSKVKWLHTCTSKDEFFGGTPSPKTHTLKPKCYMMCEIYDDNQNDKMVRNKVISAKISIRTDGINYKLL